MGYVSLRRIHQFRVPTDYNMIRNKIYSQRLYIHFHYQTDLLYKRWNVSKLMCTVETRQVILRSLLIQLHKFNTVVRKLRRNFKQSYRIHVTVQFGPYNSHNNVSIGIGLATANRHVGHSIRCKLQLSRQTRLYITQRMNARGHSYQYLWTSKSVIILRIG